MNDMQNVTPNQPTAKTFHDPLLKVLGSLNNYITEATVVHTDVYAPVLALAGVSPNDYGIAPGTLIPQTNRWIQFAFQALKNEGLAVTPKKGQWGLTEAGVQASRTLAGLPRTGIVTPMPAPAPTPVAVSTPAPAPVITLHKPMPSAYDSDPYLRSLAVAASNCIGYYSIKSETCQTCPLVLQCRNKAAADLSALAAELHKADMDAVRVTSPVSPSAPASAPTTASSSKRWNNSGIDKIVNHTETVCYRCHNTIPMKAQCYWKQDDGDGESGLFHLECK